MVKIRTPPYSHVLSRPADITAVINTLRKYSFVIVGNALASGTTDSVSRIQQELFGLDAATKKRYRSATPLAPGYGPFGQARALDTGAPNLLETWDIASHGVENWPLDESSLNALRDLGGELFRLAHSILCGIENAAGASSGSLSGLVKVRDANVHLIHYFPTERVPENASRRQSIHKDMTLLTLIPTPSAPGLAMKTKRGWIKPQMGPDEVVIQTGLILERLTAGEWGASIHTVDSDPVNLRSSRYSFPYFLSPAGDVLLQTLPPFRHPNGQDESALETVEEFRHSYFERVFPVDSEVSD